MWMRHRLHGSLLPSSPSLYSSSPSQIRRPLPLPRLSLTRTRRLSLTRARCPSSFHLSLSLSRSCAGSPALDLDPLPGALALLFALPCPSPHPTAHALSLLLPVCGPGRSPPLDHSPVCGGPAVPALEPSGNSRRHKLLRLCGRVLCPLLS